MRDICIVDIDPRDESGSIRRIRELITDTGQKSVAFMVTAVPDEQSLERRLKDWVRRFGLLKDGLKGLHAEVGILIQALIGHGDRNRIVGELPFQTIVGSDGTVCRESFCPLDTGFQAYTRQLIQTLAGTAPAFFMIDDDFRIASHSPADNGCMCPLHLNRFSQILGVGISREELVSRFQADNGGEILAQWERLKEDSLVELAQIIRDAIDSVDEAIPGMYCCVTFESHLAPAITEVLAGRHRPLARINNAIYLENGHKHFPQRVAWTFHQIAQFSPNTMILTEADTCPQNRYSLSVKSHLAHITATVLAGCDGAKYWFPKTDKFGRQETAPYRRMLEGIGPFFREIESIRDSVTWSGPAVTARMKEIWCKPWAGQTPSGTLSDDWGGRVFGRMGIPFTLTPGSDADDSPRVMSGAAPLAYTDDELRVFLSGALLLDGEAAWHISRRGFGEYLGVDAEPSSDPCSYEVIHVVPGSVRTKEIVTGMSGGGRYRLSPLSDEVFTASSYVTGSAANPVETGSALTWYENGHGGRIAVYGLSMHAPLEWTFFNSKRRTQLIEALTWLNDGMAPVVVETDLDVFVLHGRDNTDETREYICLFNLNPDTVEGVSVSLPGRAVRSVEKLELTGGWKAVGFTSEEAVLHCSADAATMEPFIARLVRG